MYITRFEMLLDQQAEMVRRNGMCLSSFANCDTICTQCADAAEQAFKNEVKRKLERATTLLRSYGFTVEEE